MATATETNLSVKATVNRDVLMGLRDLARAVPPTVRDGVLYEIELTEDELDSILEAADAALA